MSDKTRKVVVKAEDGTKVTLVVPVDLPSDERAEYLRELFGGKVPGVEVLFPKGDWKGPVEAKCDPAVVPDLMEAMRFFGAPVDAFGVSGNDATLFSHGYYAHGF